MVALRTAEGTWLRGPPGRLRGAGQACCCPPPNGGRMGLESCASPSESSPQSWDPGCQSAQPNPLGGGRESPGGQHGFRSVKRHRNDVFWHLLLLAMRG